MVKIEIFDTTLRDGEQTPGVNFNTREKLQIAKQLEAWGVDVIEAGFPVSSEGDFEAVKTIGESLNTARVCGLARSSKKDIDRVDEALKNAKNKQIHVFIATSPIHREYKLKMTQEEILDTVKEHVSYAAERFDHVQFSPEDATRTEKDFLAEVVQTAIENGATVINIPDTVGYTNPVEFGELFQFLQENVKSFDQAVFSAHCHDDLGLAVANSLAAVENGALRIEGAVNGIGERAGNTALEEIAIGLHIRKDYYGFETNFVLNETKQTSDLVSRLSGMPVPRNKAVIGANAYAHESGIHQDGVLKNPETYEIITPQLVGVEETSLPLGKLSGLHAFKSHLEKMGYDMSDNTEAKKAFVEFKELADKKKVVTETDLHAIVTGQNIESDARYELVKLGVQFIEDDIHAATVTVKDSKNEDSDNGGMLQDTGTGKGSVEAIYQTINLLLGSEDAVLLEYSIDAITEGYDAQAQVHVVVQNSDGEVYNGTGIDFDVLTASAKAYIQALSLGE